MAEGKRNMSNLIVAHHASLSPHPAMSRITRCAKAGSEGDFVTAHKMLLEADLCFARDPVPGAAAAMVKAKKVLWMEERRVDAIKNGNLALALLANHNRKALSA